MPKRKRRASGAYTKLTSTQWARIRALWESGETASHCARLHGISVHSVGSRKRKEGWVRVSEESRGATGRESRPVDLGTLANDPAKCEKFAIATNSHLDPAPAPAKSLLPALLNAAASDPADFQTALAGLVERLVAEGMPDLEPPRTVAELARCNDLIRKARGLDTAGQAGSHVRPLRTISRVQPPTIDVTPDPEPPSNVVDGFEI